MDHRLRDSAVVVFTFMVAFGVAGCRRTPSPQGLGGAPSAGSDELEGADVMDLKIRSTAFSDNETIPTKYTGDGDDVSPPLSWSGAPDGSRAFALICDDPDAPTAEPWVHWVMYDIPGDTTGLGEAVPKEASLAHPAGAKQGRNSFGKIGYGGPAPPKGHGLHHYHFKVYALDAAIELPGTVDKNRLLDAIQGHVLATGELTGTYERK